jgi:spore germination protein YaaH
MFARKNRKLVLLVIYFSALILNFLLIKSKKESADNSIKKSINKKNNKMMIKVIKDNKIVFPLLVIAFAISLLSVGVFAYVNYFDEDTIMQRELEQEWQRKKEAKKEQNSDLNVGGWVPDWASASGLESLQNNNELFDNFSPVWYEIQEDGSLLNKVPKNHEEIILYARNHGIEIIPSIALFDHETLTSVLQSEENLDRHVEDIHGVVMDNNFDGIDLDYESTKLSDKDKYFELLERLDNRFEPEDKKLVVTVLPKWGDEVEYLSLKETREVQDWSLISNYADEIRVMAYDYTYIMSKNPGPIAPLEWVEEVIKYGVSKVDSKKLTLGVHLYSYEWWEEVPEGEEDVGFEAEDLQFKSDYNQNGVADSANRSYSYLIVQRVLDQYEGELDEFQGEKIYRYSKVNDDTQIFENRVLVYIDDHGVQERINLAMEYNLRGVSFWRLGADGNILNGLNNQK